MRVLAPPARTRPNNGASADIALTSALFDQSSVGDDDVMRQRFAHVVNGERRDARPGERFHFHAGLVMNGDGAADHRIIAFHVDHEIALLDTQWMTERNQLMRTL